MAKFLYTAKSYDGKTKGGEIEAKDEKSAVVQIKADGFLVTSIQEAKEEKRGVQTKFNLRIFSVVPLKEKMVFARNLSVMVDSGLSIGKALENLSIQVQNKAFRVVIAKMYKDVQAGKSLSESMAKHPNVFNELFVNMVRVGEIGGNLEEVLSIVAVQLEKENALKSKVRGAMMYPAVILVAMAAVGFLMLTYILPKITSVFKDMDVELPASTQFIINVSDFLRSNVILVLSVVVFGGIFLRIFFRTVPGKKLVSLIALNFPITKKITIKINCARFSRIYSSLLRSGVSVLDALDIIANTLSNYEYKTVLSRASEDIQKGVSLSSVINANPKIFPPLVGQMAEVGEETGKTETMFLKLADFYEEEVNQITKNLSSVIEPVLMVLMGCAVGFFAVSMLQPMYGLMENIQ